MATKFQDEIDMALELIQENGIVLTYFRPRVISVNPVTKEVIEVSSLVGNATAVLLNVSQPSLTSHEVSRIDELKVAKTKKLLIAAKGLVREPILDDVWHLGTRDGSDWKTIGITSLDPDGTPIIYTLIVGK